MLQELSITQEAAQMPNSKAAVCCHVVTPYGCQSRVHIRDYKAKHTDHEAVKQINLQ